MTGIISVNLKKIKMSAKVNALIGENYRDEDTAERYDNGQRIIDTDKTRDNVFLLERPADYDRFRRDRIDRVNNARAGRMDLALHTKKSRQSIKDSGELQAAASREAAATRKLRADTVDTIGLVVQPSADFINAMNPDEQTRFFRDSLEVMQAHPDWFGRIETAVIHYDENTPHMQCLATTINEETLTSDCQKIMGNKTKMSDRQTLLANEMQAKGWDIERGIKRVDNPDYKNFKDEMEAQGYKVTRFNDAKLMAAQKELEEGRREVLRGQEKNRQDKFDNDMAKVKNAAEETRQLSKENELNGRDAILSTREGSLKTKEENLRTWEARLRSQQKALDEQKQKNDAREARLNERVEAFNEAGRKFTAVKKKTLKMADTVSEQQKRNEALATQLEQRTASLDLLEKGLVLRERAVQKRESAVETWEKTVEVREKALTNSRERATEELQSMAGYVRSMTEEQLKKLNERLKPAENMDDFIKLVGQIDTANNGLGL